VIIKNNKQHQFHPIYLFYFIFSFIFIITWFFPYYEVCATGWGLPCTKWYYITGFSFMINNSLSITGFFGVVLEISSSYLFYRFKIKTALIFVSLGNILIGISLIYLSFITTNPSMLRYDVYLLYNLKLGYIFAVFLWSVMCCMNLIHIFVEVEKNRNCKSF